MKCRKNVKSLTPDEKKRFVNAFLALKAQDSVIHPGSQSRYDDFVECHMNAMTATVGWAHNDSVFFPWHRELLYQFEQLLQSVDPSVTIPYWDWTRHKTGADAGFPFKHDFIGVDGTDADSDRVKRDPTAPAVDPTHPYIYPFDPELWTITVDDGDGLTFFQRQFGEYFDAPSLPDNDSVVTGVNSSYRNAINAADYLALRSRSESIHNLVHRWVGGNMLRMTSPNDPVFFMHHASIDRMWSIWQKKAPGGIALYQQSSSASGHKLNDAMIFNNADPPPFTTGTTIAQVVDGHTMHGTGVWYESDVPELTNETGATLSFTDIPEGLTSYKAVKFRIKGCRPVNFRITGAPTGQFGLADMGGIANVTEFVAHPDDAADFYYGYVWVKLVAIAGAIPNSSVDIHAYFLDDEGYYAATEGGEVALGDYHIDLTATTVARENNSVTLVLDRSGSMADPAGPTSAKSDLLQNAIQVFRDLMLGNDEIAVVTFDDVIDTPIAMQQVSGAPAFSTIDLVPRNETWIGGGIQQGAVQLASATHTNRSMIVLTDGNENVHPYIGEIDPSLITNRTYAIGLGAPGSVSDTALQQITNNTHGDLIITGNISTDEQRFNLTKYFVQVLAGVTKMDIILDPQGSLFLGSKHVIPFQLSNTDVYADLIMLCPVPQIVDFSLETPDGTIITPAIASAEPNISYVVGQQVAFYRVSLPALAADPDGSRAGTWKAILAIKGSDDFKKLGDDRSVLAAIKAGAARGSLPYSFVVHAYSNLTFSVSKRQESLQPGASVTLFGALKEYDVPLSTPATVWAEITNPDQSTFELKLNKVGAGSYSASFTTSSSGAYRCRVRAEGLTSGGSPFTREQTVTAGVYYGDHNPTPGFRPDASICHLIECFLSDKVLSPEGVRRLEEMGIDVKRLQECVAKVCASAPKERIPGLVHKAFLEAQKQQREATPSVSFKKTAPAKTLKQPVVPGPKPRRKVDPPTMFTAILDTPDERPKHPHKKDSKK